MSLNRAEILQDYVNYCIDTKRDTKSKKSKEIYLNAYIHFLYALGKFTLDDIEKKEIEIKNILKYNSLTIEKLKQEKLKDL